MTDKQLFEHLAKTNNPDYCISKTIEELNELATILGQYLNKPHNRHLYLGDITKEMADVSIRIKLLKRALKNDGHIKNAIRAKLDTYKQYVNKGKYTGKI